MLAPPFCLVPWMTSCSFFWLAFSSAFCASVFLGTVAVFAFLWEPQKEAAKSDFFTASPPAEEDRASPDDEDEEAPHDEEAAPSDEEEEEEEAAPPDRQCEGKGKQYRKVHRIDTTR